MQVRHAAAAVLTCLVILGICTEDFIVM